MNSSSLSSLPLRCPLSGSSLELLDNDREILAINEAIEKGDLTLAAGTIPKGAIDSILISADGQNRYPVIDGVPCLLGDFRIVKYEENDSVKTIDLQMSSLQRKQWKAVTARYEKWVGGPDGIITKTQEEFQRRNTSLLSEVKNGAVILDVGNGGATSSELLGQKIADSIQTFYALDNSYPMLTRSGTREGNILGDARSIPLSDNSVDYVTINNVLHHLGRHVDAEPSIKMKEVFDEAFRVSRKGIIGVEVLVPHIGEQLEILALQFLKFMPTFVYSEGFYRNLMTDLGAEVIDFESILQCKLMTPFKFFPPIMDLPFIQLPAFLMPYSFLFYHLRSNASD